MVNLEFSGGETVSFTMVAFTEKICERETRIHFTNGELIGDMDSFTTLDFAGLNILGHDERLANSSLIAPKQRHQPTVDSLSGHGGGDLGLIATFVEAVKLTRQDVLGLTVDDILASHLTVRDMTLHGHSASKSLIAASTLLSRSLLLKRVVGKVEW